MASSEFTGASGTAISRSNIRQAGDDVFSSTRDTAILLLPPRSSISLDQMSNDLGENAKTPYPIYNDFSASIDTNKRSVAHGDPAGAKLCPMPPRACERGVGKTAIGLNGNSFDPGALADHSLAGDRKPFARDFLDWRRCRPTGVDASGRR